MLAVTTCLRLLAAEKRAYVKELDWLRQFIEAMLQVGPYSSGGALWTQGDIGAVALLVGAVIETVHFMFDDIGTFANGALKDSCLFQYRRFDASVSIELSYFSSRLLNKVPVGLLIGQNISKSLQRLIAFSHGIIHSLSSTLNYTIQYPVKNCISIKAS